MVKLKADRTRVWNVSFIGINIFCEGSWQIRRGKYFVPRISSEFKREVLARTEPVKLTWAHRALNGSDTTRQTPAGSYHITFHKTCELKTFARWKNECLCPRRFCVMDFNNASSNACKGWVLKFSFTWIDSL